MTVMEAMETGSIFREAATASREEIAAFAYVRRYGKGMHVFYEIGRAHV